MAKVDAPDQKVLKHTVNDKTRSIVKVVEVPLNEDYQEPDGYILKELYHDTINGEVKFFAILVKIQEVMQGNVERMPARNKPTNLKDGSKSPKVPKNEG